MRATLKKFVRVAMMAAALTAGNVMGMGCSTDGGNTIDDDQTTTNPGDTGDKDKDNTNPGDNTGDKDTTPNDKYGTPYDKAIGNGNYILHNFISDNDNIKRDTAVEDVNHYLELGEDYINGMLDGFSESLNSRPTAKNYFNDMITNIQNDNNNKFHITSGSINMDAAMNNILRHTAPVLTDIINNVNTIGEKYAIYDCYKALKNEAYKEGLGSARKDANSTLMEEYENEKQYMIGEDEFDDIELLNNISFAEAYRTNNFTPITDLLDELLTTSANSMKTNQGIDITTADLRQIINLNFAISSLRGMHNYTQNLVGHQNNCVSFPYRDVEAMYNAMLGITTTQTKFQYQGLSM